MDYGKTISRAVNVVMENKYLIALGILVALGSGTFGGSGSGIEWSEGGGNGNGQPFGGGTFPNMGGEETALIAGGIILIMCVVLFVALAFWAVSTIARGGLVAAVNDIEMGAKSSFGEAWRAGWQKAGRLLGIGILPGIPGILLMFVVVLGFIGYGSVAMVTGGSDFSRLGMSELGIMLGVTACLLVPIALILSILRTFAERACMLEDLGVIESYRRGWEVLRENMGEAVMLFLIQIGISILLGLVLFVPGIIVALCCLLWPLLFIFQGFVSAAVSALWTLAWREWTGAAPKMMEKAPVGF